MRREIVFGWLMLWSVMAHPAQAQRPAYLVKDINLTPSRDSGSNPRNFVTIAGISYFSADDGIHGNELWRTDGTGSGTRMVKDIWPGEHYSGPLSLTDVDGRLFFVAGSGGYHCGLWRSDGTSAGTLLVREFPGTMDGCFTLYDHLGPKQLTVVNGRLFFVADDDTHGSELWKSDGTAEGTVMLRDIREGDEIGSGPETLTAVDGILLFFADDGIHGQELWRSDGTSSGTVMVKDIQPGPLGSTVHDFGSPTIQTASMGGALFFFANGAKLWRSDGSEVGTVEVKTLPPAPFFLSAVPTELTSVSDRIFFIALDAGGFELWTSDGTEEGTRIVASLPLTHQSTVYPPQNFAAFGDLLAFAAVGSNGSTALWISDGTRQGTRAIKDLSLRMELYQPNGLISAAGRLFFAADDGQHGCELWQSDGTESGTRVVKDLRPGTEACSYDTGPFIRGVLGDEILFSADDGTHGRELFRSDGTEAGTVLVKDINPVLNATADAFGGESSWVDSVNGILLFTANDGSGSKLWRTDGRAAGTTLMPNISIGERAHIHDALLFSAYDPAIGVELWRTDGTVDGTRPLKDLNPGPMGSNPGDFIVVDDLVYFFATNAQGRRQLCRSDGTGEGTAFVGDGTTGLPARRGPIVNVDGTLFFGGDELSASIVLWKVDTRTGVASKVSSVKLGRGDLSPPELQVVGGRLFFSACTPRSGCELWQSDGTAAGTGMVKDINPGSADSFPSDLAESEGRLFFRACEPQHGCEVWASDGTSEGTRILHDPSPGPASSYFHGNPFALDDRLVFFACTGDAGCGMSYMDGAGGGTQLVANPYPEEQVYVGDKFFFSQEEGVAGVALWVSDGTQAGTRRLKIVDPRPRESIEERRLGLTAVAGYLMFDGYDPEHGFEPWVSDGTAAGTKPAADIAPGAASSFYNVALQQQFFVSGETVYFVANDHQHGRELWAIPLAALSSSCTGDCDGRDGVTVDELIKGVNIALGIVPLSDCSVFDSNHDDSVTVDDLVAAVNDALNSCGG
jgi:ELWxxDGT repeat protein